MRAQRLREYFIPTGDSGHLVTALVEQRGGPEPIVIGQPDGGDRAQRAVPEPGADTQDRSADSGREIGHDRRRLHGELLERAANRAVGHHVAGTKLQADLGIRARSNSGNIEVHQQLGLQVTLPQQSYLLRHAVPALDECERR